MRLVRRRTRLASSRPPTSANACQMAGTTRRSLLANRSASAVGAGAIALPRAAAAGESLDRTLGQPGGLQLVELLDDRRPGHTAGRIKSLMACGGLPTSNLTIRKPAALTSTSGAGTIFPPLGFRFMAFHERQGLR